MDLSIYSGCDEFKEVELLFCFGVEDGQQKCILPTLIEASATY